jgi:nucleotide-binding universal stress UspA family protein
MLKQLAVGIDGSPESMSTFEQGLFIAKKLSCQIKLVFVIDRRKTQIPYIYSGTSYDVAYERIYIPIYPDMRAFYGKLNTDLRSFASNCISLCVEKARKLSIPIIPEIREGLPSEELCAASRTADILLIGQKGEHAEFRREIVGSTTENIVRSSPRPVLVCPGKVTDFSRILFAYDESLCAENALQFFVHSMRDFVSDFLILKVGEEDREVSCTEQESEFLSQHTIQSSVLCRKGYPPKVILENAPKA